MFNCNSTKEVLHQFVKQYKIEPNDILAIYNYGSIVYGTNGKLSDQDYIVVVKDCFELPNDTIKGDNIDVTIYSHSSFLNKIQEHEISVLECLFLPPEHITQEDIHYADYFKLNLTALRKSISAKSSNSFVKARKKIAIGEYYIGRKSLWHSFRIIMFGIQLAEHGKIVDYRVANSLYQDIVQNENTDPQYYKDKYVKLHNSLTTEFRKLAPK